ncbi:MAG: cation:proton antiporter [Anaerolineae bacterium]|nr:cation:proton antiporter [Gemmatimonadaceae bacterium]
MHPELGFLGDLLTLFGLGVAVVLIMSRIGLPPIVGFLLTGVLCGPYGFGLISNVRDVEGLAEIGVVLLLFTVGIEFSVQQLVRMRTFLLLGGGLHVTLSLGVTFLLARIAGQPWNVSVFLGLLVALSSTAIVLRLFTDRGEIDTPHGQATIGILIFQDLCIVPMVLLTPFLSGETSSLGEIAIIVAKILLFAVAAVLAARYVFPWFLHQVVRTRKREVFLLAIILLCLGTAWVSAQIGLSLALGAFIAGLVISESDYSHQALGEILPLREVFNSLFFLSIGMLFNVRTVLESPLLVLGVFATVVLVKAAVGIGVCFGLGQSLRVAIVAGLALAQIGEFSFVLSKVGLETGLLDERLNQLFLAVAVGTMTASPALIALGPRLAALLESRLPARFVSGRRLLPSMESHRNTRLEDHVIIVGYGLNGRNLARVLGRSSIPFAVIEMNPDAVRSERKRGRSIIYGDATRPEILEHAGILRARVLVIAISDAAATRSAVALARRLNDRAHIIVRSRYLYEMEPLVVLGTNEVISEEYETSIEIFSRVLQRYLVPRDKIEQLIRDVRSDGYQAFRSVANTYGSAEALGQYVSGLTVEVYRAEPGSELEGKTLGESRIRERGGATVVAIQREDGDVIANPAVTDVIRPGDSVVLLGRAEQLAAVASLFRAAATDTKAPDAAMAVSGQVEAVRLN